MNTTTLCEKVGCGNIYLLFTHDEKGKFKKLFLRGDMAKNCDCGESFLNALAGVLTFAIRRAIREGNGALEEGIIKQLKSHFCSVRGIRGSTSCVDAISKGLVKYKEKYAVPKEVVQCTDHK